MQWPKHSLDEGILAATDKRRIKFRFGFKGCHQVSFGERSFQPGESVPDPSHDRGVAQTGAFTAGESFEHGTCRVKLPCFIKTDGADDGTAMGDRIDETVGLQQPKCLANRRPTDTRHLAKLAFHQPLARLQGPGHDRFAQLLRDPRPDGWNVLDPKRGLQFSAFVHCSIAFVRSVAMTRAVSLPPTAIGTGSIAIYGQNHHLRNLNMGWLVQRKQDRSCDIRRIERQLELPEVVFFLLPVAAVAGEDDTGSRESRLHLGYPDRRLGKFSSERFGKHMHACLARAVGSHVRNDTYGVDRADV